MKIAIGCDPNAYEYKTKLIPFIQNLGHEVVDFGSTDPIYAHTAISLAEAVAAKKCDRGILICGTGIGVCIAANKVKGVYAAEVNNIYQAERAQLSNNANVITLGAQVIGLELAKCFIREYLKNTFDPNSRSGPKVDAIAEYEDACAK